MLVKVRGFDAWMILINLPCDKHSVDNIINGKGIIEIKVFNGYIQKIKRQSPQYLHFGCAMTHLKYFSKKLGKTFKITK